MNDTPAHTHVHLVERLRQSEEKALGEAFDLFHDPLYRYAAGIVSREDALDVTQEVFVQLWEMREALAIRVSLQSLLYRMTRNRALNVRRKLKRVELPGELPDAPVFEPESTEALQRAMRKWLAELPPRRAEAFTLSRYHDLSHEQISRIMGLSVRTVQTHVVHALRDLRGKLDAWRQASKTAEIR